MVIRRRKRLRNLTFKQLKKKGIKLKARGDADRDGVRNKKDCRPLNRKKQGVIHDLVAGVGKTGGYIVGEARSGWRDIPAQFRRQQIITTRKEALKEAKRDLAAARKLREIQGNQASAVRRRSNLVRQIQKGDIVFARKKGKVRAFMGTRKKRTVKKRVKRRRKTNIWGL